MRLGYQMELFEGVNRMVSDENRFRTLDAWHLRGYTLMGIKSFRHKGLEEFFLTGSKRGIRPEHAGRLEEVLDLLHRAAIVNDMAYSGSHLHPLQGELDGYWSVRISGNWRLIFRFKGGDAYAVTYVDYH